MSIETRLKEVYDSFQGFPPKNPIVRLNIPHDAFTLVVFEILFRNFHSIQKLDYNNREHIQFITQSIIPPPDDSIDIFYEEKQIDDCKYHIVQVKNQKLTQAEIETCFLQMESTVKQYLKKPKDIRRNTKELIANTDFNSQYKNDITYYVVHRGSDNYIRHQRASQIVITDSELELLSNGALNMSVPFERFEIDTTNNFIVNNFIDGKGSNVNSNLPKSLLCNLSGYDLAVLNNKYSNTILGRNILYGQNLRESLKKTSKTFDKMFETISNEPDLFLYYNNGITILSTFFDTMSVSNSEHLTVKDFSIINGAQTSSTLGAYLREAEINDEPEKIEQLKKVFVLTKIYEINKGLKNHETVSERIKIYNNTQTPLSSRDMVSIRSEQLDLQNKLLTCASPNIFVNIKKGVEVPSHPKTFPHQRITNETLAQLALCGFSLQPFSAKDKKSKIFDNDGTDQYLLNETYNNLFHPTTGILFNKSNIEIDELLFVYKIHEDAKKNQKKALQDRINTLNQTQKDPIEKAHLEDTINKTKRSIEITNVCLFYNLTTYYKIKQLFDSGRKSTYDSKRYYNDKEYKDSLVKSFISIFYTRTVNIIRSNSGLENINNWVRSEKSQKTFLDALDSQLDDDIIDIKEQYIDFTESYKI